MIRLSEIKPKVTLIGTTLARVDLEFIYEGESAECEGCTVMKACHNLKPGRRYRIVGVRKTRHACPLHLDGATAVEVVESSVPALISADMAIRNTRISFEPSCTRESCEHFPLCYPDGLVPGEKYVVVQVLGNAPPGCAKGRNLQRVELRSA